VSPLRHPKPGVAALAAPAGAALHRRRVAVVALALFATVLLHGVLVDGLWRIGADRIDRRPPRLSALYVRTLAPEPLPWSLIAGARPALQAPALVAPRAPWLTVPVLPPLSAASAPQDGVLAAAGSPVAAADVGPGPEPSSGGVPAWPPGMDGMADDAHAGLPAGTAAGASAPGWSSPASPASPAAGAMPTTTDDTAAAPSTGAAPAADAAAGWPPSTRLRYALTGHWRGPLEGHAQVEWLREGTHYQVHVDVVIGPPFAPLISRQASSDGEVGPAGLTPRRYDERTRVLWRSPVVATVGFEPGRVQLPGGRWRPAPPGVQDAASQFVHLAWRFERDPALLTPGRVVTLPLALPSGVGLWVYDVREAETLATPAGPMPAVRLQPRRRPRGGDLVPEVWFAPTLQHLPVRILIRHSGDSHADLTIDRLPEQAAPPALATDTPTAAEADPPPRPRRRPPRP
jgi:hypothetical protein